jgi:hypothetical protein
VKLQQHSHFKEKLVRMGQMKTDYTIPLVLSTAGIIPHKQHDSLKLLNLRPNLYILMQKAAILNASRIAGKILAER